MMELNILNNKNLQIEVAYRWKQHAKNVFNVDTFVTGINRSAFVLLMKDSSSNMNYSYKH